MSWSSEIFLMRAWLDTDVMLDLLPVRTLFADAATELWKASLAGQFEGYISAITLTSFTWLAN